MSNRLNYTKKFIIFKDDYSNMKELKSKGHGKLELKGNNLNVSLNIKGAEANNYYNVDLIKRREAYTLGKVYTKEDKSAEREIDVSYRELEKNGFSLKEVDGIILSRDSKVLFGEKLKGTGKSLAAYVDQLGQEALAKEDTPVMEEEEEIPVDYIEEDTETIEGAEPVFADQDLAEVEEVAEVEEFIEVEQVPEAEELSQVEEASEVEEFTEAEQVPEEDQFFQEEQVPEVEQFSQEEVEEEDPVEADVIEEESISMEEQEDLPVEEYIPTEEYIPHEEDLEGINVEYIQGMAEEAIDEGPQEILCDQAEDLSMKAEPQEAVGEGFEASQEEAEDMFSGKKYEEIMEEIFNIPELGYENHIGVDQSDANNKNQTQANEMSEYVRSILNFFPHSEPFTMTLQGYDWWKIGMVEEDGDKSFLPYFSYIIGGDRRSNRFDQGVDPKDLLERYGHYIFGLYNEGERVKFYMYGIPGRFSLEDYPRGGNGGFNTWFEGIEVPGYWILYIEPETGKILYPINPMIPKA